MNGVSSLFIFTASHDSHRKQESRLFPICTSFFRAFEFIMAMQPEDIVNIASLDQRSSLFNIHLLNRNNKKIRNSLAKSCLPVHIEIKWRLTLNIKSIAFNLYTEDETTTSGPFPLLLVQGIFRKSLHLLSPRPLVINFRSVRSL